MKHGSLFSGIGGFDIAAEWAGWENVFHCEWNPFGQKVLKHYWPNAESFSDINTSDFSKYANQLDILTGGFPCQPFSSTGKRRGKDDPRHLWPRMLEVISTIKPRWVVGENVHGLLNWSGGLVFQEVITDLENQGYEVQSFLLPAAGVGAIHKRNRIWFVAYANNDDSIKHSKGRLDLAGQTMDELQFNKKKSRHKRLGVDATNSMRERLEKKESLGQSGESRISNQLLREHGEAFESALLGENDGIPRELDGITFPKWRMESAQAYGNAIVPQVAYQIFKAINEYERSR
jgi:DNA (cytosine-5)-methyltransferase 1